MILKAQNIKMEFERKRKDTNILEVLNEFNLEVPEGKLLLIMGESGKGKTTILNIISGLLNPTEGNVFLDETDIYSLNDKELSKLRSENFGMVPQGQTLLRSLNVLDNILLPIKLYRNPSDDDIKRAKDLIDEMGITDLIDVMPSEMSGGELRRAAIARALINNPKILFADEPTSDLDSKNRNMIIDIFKAQRDKGVSVVMVTHDDSLKDIADILINLNEEA
ncbi:MAG: ABC transporter ATP-binding protein [Acholeplasmatales bacterium]|nr:ABC transporter ATP-binding protein [Acholeplasmatales bacterium]